MNTLDEDNISKYNEELKRLNTEIHQIYENFKSLKMTTETLMKDTKSIFGGNDEHRH